MVYGYDDEDDEMNDVEHRIVDNAVDHLRRGKMLCKKGHNVLAAMEIEQAMGYLSLLE